MIEQIRFTVIYEDGVLKPETPLELPEHGRFTVTIQTAESEAQPVHLGGSWSEYAPKSGLSYEEIEALTKDAHTNSLNQLLDQIDGKSS